MKLFKRRQQEKGITKVFAKTSEGKMDDVSNLPFAMMRFNHPDIWMSEEEKKIYQEKMNNTDYSIFDNMTRDEVVQLNTTYLRQMQPYIMSLLGEHELTKVQREELLNLTVLLEQATNQLNKIDELAAKNDKKTIIH